MADNIESGEYDPNNPSNVYVRTDTSELFKNDTYAQLGDDYLYVLGKEDKMGRFTGTVNVGKDNGYEANTWSTIHFKDDCVTHIADMNGRIFREGTTTFDSTMKGFESLSDQFAVDTNMREATKDLQSKLDEAGMNKNAAEVETATGIDRPKNMCGMPLTS